MRLIDADALNIHDVSPAYGMTVMGVTEDDIDDAPTIESPIHKYPDEKPNDENKTYLIRTDCGYWCSARWTNVNPFWTYLTTDWHWNYADIPQYSNVVAWMEIPEYVYIDKGDE